MLGVGDKLARQLKTLMGEQQASREGRTTKGGCVRFRLKQVKRKGTSKSGMRDEGIWRWRWGDMSDVKKPFVALPILCKFYARFEHERERWRKKSRRESR